MIKAGTLPLRGTRTAPFGPYTIRFNGINFTGADLVAEVRQKWDNPGDPEVALPDGVSAGVTGIRLTSTGTTSGVPYSIITIFITETDMSGLAYAGEIGQDLTWKWRLWATPSGGYKAVYLEGNFIVGGSAAGSGSGEPYDAIVTIADETVTVNLGAAEIYSTALADIAAAGATQVTAVEDEGTTQTGLVALAAAAATNTPNGTMRRWLSLVTTAGSGASSTVQDALVTVEQQLYLTGLISKIVRLNLRCGNGAAAARIPFVMRVGCGIASETGTLSSWTEASGLTGFTLSTGLTFEQAGLNAYNVGLGCYVVNSPGGSPSSYVLRASDSSWGFSPLYSSGVNFAVGVSSVFAASPYNKPDVSYIAGGTYYAPALGSFSSIRGHDGVHTCYRNGIALPEISVPAISNTPLTQTLSIDTTAFGIGGDWVTEALTASEAAELHWIVHNFNVAIGRGVTAEGL